MGIGDTIRVVINSISFFILLALAYYLFQFNPYIGIIFALASIDQIEDVYRITTGRHPIPAYLAPFDIIFETILAVTGLFMLILSVVYWYSFESWFFAILTVLSIAITLCAISDIAEDVKAFSGKLSLSAEASKASVLEKEIESFRFFRKL
jgi:hypothetical protein